MCEACVQYLVATAESTGAVGADPPVVARGVGPLEDALTAGEGGGQVDVHQPQSCYVVTESRRKGRKFILENEH